MILRLISDIRDVIQVTYTGKKYSQIKYCTFILAG